MRLVNVTLQNRLVIAINPHCISHLQPLEGQTGCMLFMDGDNLPTNLMDDPVELLAAINDAMGEDIEAIRNGDCEHMANMEKLIGEIRRLTLVSCGLAAIFFILLLISIFHR